MLNPALGSLLISSCAWAHRHVSGRSLPIEYAFLVLPLVLHRSTRRELPSNTNSLLTKWVAERPLVQAAFALRARSLVPFTREALRYGVGCQQIEMNGDGTLSGSAKRSAALEPETELNELVRAAALVGRWLAKVERPSTLFALLGVTP